MMYAIVDMHFDDRGRYLCSMFGKVYMDADVASITFWKYAFHMHMTPFGSVILGDYLITKAFLVKEHAPTSSWCIQTVFCIDGYSWCVDTEELILTQDDIAKVERVMIDFLGRS